MPFFKAFAPGSVDVLLRGVKSARAEVRSDCLLILGRAAGKDRRAEKGPKFQLPSDEDVDRAFGYMQRLMRKFKEKMRELDSDGERRSL